MTESRIKITRTAAQTKKRITIDLDNWELGDWPDKLAELVEYEKGDDCITIRVPLSGEKFDAAAKEIAAAAVSTFIEDIRQGDYRIEAHAEGIVIADQYNETRTRYLLKDWEDIDVIEKTEDSTEALDQIEKWLAAMKADRL